MVVKRLSRSRNASRADHESKKYCHRVPTQAPSNKRTFRNTEKGMNFAI